MPRTDWIQRVSTLGLALNAEQVEQLTQYLFLLRKWSSFKALVSSGNLSELEDLHLVDSLSLAPVVRATTGAGDTLLDIGSGGGFPAIPLAVALPDRHFVLMERNLKKISFLRKVCGALGLKHVELIHGSFPRDVPPSPPAGITARAVERADQVLADIADLLPPGVVFYCQSGDPKGKLDDAVFHVEHWEDEWTRAGARRGRLDLVRVRSEAN